MTRKHQYIVRVFSPSHLLHCIWLLRPVDLTDFLFGGKIIKINNTIKWRPSLLLLFASQPGNSQCEWHQLTWLPGDIIPKRLKLECFWQMQSHTAWEETSNEVNVFSKACKWAVNVSFKHIFCVVAAPSEPYLVYDTPTQRGLSASCPWVCRPTVIHGAHLHRASPSFLLWWPSNISE